MADQTTPPAGSGLVIPADTELRFATMIGLIRGSESMNDEERQYWINILPIMTQEQLKNLEEILTSEKKQLAEIDQKYSQQSSPSSFDPGAANLGEKIRERKAKREEIERQNSAVEAKEEDDLLSKIQSL